METEQLKSVLDNIRSSVDSFAGRIDSLQKQTDSIDLKMQGRPSTGEIRNDLDSVVKAISADEGFQHLQRSGRGRAIITVANLLGLETRSAITSGTLVPAERVPGIGDSGRRRYRLRDIIPILPISTGSAHFVRETAFTSAASPQVEALAKAESAFTFEAAEAPVRTIAHFTSASKQVLDDLAELGEHVRTSLIYGLDREFETQLLLGDGTGVNISGLVTTATAFDTTLLVAGDGWEYVDQLRMARLQLEEAGYACTAFVVPPRIWARIELQKDGNGQYINQSPTAAALEEVLWNRVVVPSPAMGNTFLAGDFTNGCHIRMRQDSTIDISDSHSDFFIKNLLAIRAEMRAALVKSKPGAFVYGTFSQSPA